ncbi:MAG TPA: serine/threonine-protein kinase, partial [Candidatus Kapabacteria bacterium]|nr:serine/threonine-protein kinase [Candidatus Kapabacteria bacterium]
MDEPLDPLIGRILNNAFRIESLLADGGMSRVYLAHQISLARTVVIKMLLPGFNDPDFIQLFLREARVNSNLNHPNIVGVFDFGQTEDGLVFLAMEYLEGATLADVVQGQGDGQKGLTLANIVWLMEQLCNAVSAAHQQQVVHRDLKPGNVMVARLAGNTTVVKVVDFGISKPMDEENLKHTQMGAVM